MHRTGFVALTVILIGAFVPAPAQTVPKQARVPAQANRSLRAFLQTFDGDLKDRFVAALADLNGDGTPEAIVYLTSNDWCGSVGCTMLILVAEGDSWRLFDEGVDYEATHTAIAIGVEWLAEHRSLGSGRRHSAGI